jgi:hypothetical protein
VLALYWVFLDDCGKCSSSLAALTVGGDYPDLSRIRRGLQEITLQHWVENVLLFR